MLLQEWYRDVLIWILLMLCQFARLRQYDSLPAVVSILAMNIVQLTSSIGYHRRGSTPSMQPESLLVQQHGKNWTMLRTDGTRVEKIDLRRCRRLLAEVELMYLLND